MVEDVAAVEEYVSSHPGPELGEVKEEEVGPVRSQHDGVGVGGDFIRVADHSEPGNMGIVLAAEDHSHGISNGWFDRHAPSWPDHAFGMEGTAASISGCVVTNGMCSSGRKQADPEAGRGYRDGAWVRLVCICRRYT
jgi:hypothetical protein